MFDSFILDFRQHDIVHRTEYGWNICKVRWHYRLLRQPRIKNGPKFCSNKKVFIKFCTFFRFAKNAPCSGAGDKGGGGELQLVSIVWTHQLASHGTFPRHIPAADHSWYARYLSLVQQCNIVGIRNYLFRFRLFEKFWIRCYSFKMTVSRYIEFF